MVGADYGKSGVAAAVAPGPVQDAAHTKAAAEAALARAQEELAKAERAERDAAKPSAATKRNHAKKVANLQRTVDSAQAAVTKATLDEQRARDLLGTNRNKGAHCVGKALRGVEMAEQRERHVREERLALFDTCLAGGATHRTLAESVTSLHHVQPGDELGAVVSRLRVYWLLQIAHSSHAVRQERRNTEKLKRAFTSRYTRMVTKDLPDAVTKTRNGSFLQQNVAFPARSPRSRARLAARSPRGGGAHGDRQQ